MLLRFLRKDLGLKLISLILAVSLWYYVQYSAPDRSSVMQKARFKVDLSIEGIDDKLVALDYPEEVTLIVSGEHGTISKIIPRYFKAYIDLADKKAGIYNMSVKVTTPPEIEKVNVEPETVMVRLDPLEKRLFPIKIKPTGTLKDGYMLGKISSRPETILIKGPESYISQISEVRALCDVNEADTSLVQRVEVDVVGENEKTIDKVNAEPEFVRVTVDVRPESKNSIIPIDAVISGSPAPGYKIGRISVSPPNAIIKYNYELEAPPDFLKTTGISVESLKSDINSEISLVVPHGVSIMEPDKVKIKISIVPVAACPKK